jgi:hypothetical protein
MLHMGKHFSLIADSLVKPLASDLQGPRCDGCGEDKPLYFLFGPAWYVALGLRGLLVPSTIETKGMQRSCLECMKQSFRGASFKRWKSERNGLRSPGQPDVFWPLRRLALARELARTPPYAFFAQRQDWPVCCRHCCEYQGYPDAGSLADLVRTRQFWEAGKSGRTPLENGATAEDASTDINLFACKRCATRYYTYQGS